MLQVASESCKIQQSGRQNKTLTCPAGQLMFWAESSPFFNRVAGKVEVLAGQVNFRGSLPRSARMALELMLHSAREPDKVFTVLGFYIGKMDPKK